MGKLLTLLVAALAISVVPAGAITGGQLDENLHPNVAMIVFYQPDGRSRCSATLVSPTVLVTAAHCTDGVLGKVIATFDTVAPTPLPSASDDIGDGISTVGYSTPVPPGWLTGTPHAHPLWDGELQSNDLHDVGVVVLDEPAAATPAMLPPRNYLEGLANGNGGLNKQTFEVVGYGVFFEKPTEGPQKATAISDRTRRFTSAVGQNISSQVLKLAENENDSRAGGGGCFGDSGGPVFHAGYLVADLSFLASQFCRSSGDYYRLDIDDARMFLGEFVSVP